MCGRYVSPDEAAIERAVQVQRRSWSARLGENELFGVRYNVAPTDPVPIIRVVREVSGEREGTHMRWGFVPYWANGSSPERAPTINARIETVRTNKFFRDAWKRGQRCLVPLLGFYEWQAQQPDWQRTVPFYIKVSDREIFFLAGLWDRSTTPDGKPIESVAVITTPANRLLQDIHNSRKSQGQRVLLPEADRRMPAILAKEDHETWLSGTPDEAFDVLKPYPADLMVAWPVSNKVNTVRNDAPDLIQPVDVNPPEQLLML